MCCVVSYRGAEPARHLAGAVHRACAGARRSFSELATNPNVPPEVAAALRTKFGLDDPIYLRYLHWITAMLQGDWAFPRQPDERRHADPAAPCRHALCDRLGAAPRACQKKVAYSGSMPRPSPTRSSTRSPTRSPHRFAAAFFTGLLFHPAVFDHAGLAAFVYTTDIKATGFRWVIETGSASHHAGVVLGLFQAASMDALRALAMLDVIRLDYVTTARAKGLARPG